MQHWSLGFTLSASGSQAGQCCPLPAYPRDFGECLEAFLIFITGWGESGESTTGI